MAPPPSTDPGERGESPPAIPELACIVVLHDPCILRPCPGEKFEATGHGQYDTGWELMRGRREHGACARRRFNAGGDIDALPIDRNRTDLRASGQQRLSRQRIAWVFNPHLLGKPRKKNPDDNVDRVLGA